MAATLALTQAPVAAFPGDLSAGEYDNTTHEAGFDYFNDSDSSGLHILVDDITNRSKPVGGAWSSTETQTVEVDISRDGTGAGGCYQLSAGQFSFDSQLGSSSLHATITAGTPTCNSFANIPTPFQIDVSWTGAGPTRTSHGLTHESCLDYGFEATTTEKLSGASGSATVSAFQAGAVSTDFGVLRNNEQVTHVQGPTHDSCPQEPGAIAGGAGPPNPGRYQSTSTVASALQFDESGSVGVALTDSTNVSIPKVGPSTTTTIMQVSFNMFLNGVFAFGCFNLSPTDFSISGVASAEVDLSITDATPTCDGNPPNMPLPETLHAVWTDTAPVANFLFQDGFDCLTYHLANQGSESTDSPAVTVALTPLLANPLTPTDNSLTASTNLTVAAGTKQRQCLI